MYNKDGKRTKAAAKWNKYDTGLTKRFHYVPGLVAKAILESADFYKGFDWSKPWFYSAQAYAQEVTYNNNTSAPTLDAMNAVKMYFPILSSSLKSSEIETKANTAISKLATDLKNYNEYFSIGGKKSSLKETDANDTQKGMIGGWFHKSTDYVDQMWLDGAYMGSATLAQLAEYYKGNTNIFGSTSADWDMVTKQLNIVWDNCWDSNKQLMYHAFSATGDAKAKSDGAATWAGLSTTAPVYHSAAFWGRANAWYLYALVDALEAMKNCDQGNTKNYTTLKTHLEAQAAGILKWQDQQTGGWYQIMDKNNTYNANSYSGETWTSSYNNYIETSASTIFAAALFKAVRLGLLGDSYKAAAKKAFEGIVENFVVQDSNNGTINIWSSSLSAGLGGKSYRDGSNDYYILGKDTKRVLKEDNYTEGKVLGGFIMAATEYERAYQNQDNKQILFAKDLAPNYDFTTTTEGTLNATAYGDGTVTYQWYKDNAKIADATSATFAPKESGKYYCKATSGSTFITTNTADVIANSSPSTTTKYTVSATAGEGGTVSIKNGNEDVTSGSTVVAGSTITFTANPASGYKFKNWTVNNTTNNETSTTLTISKIAANTIVVANFEKDSSTETETTSVIFDYTVPTTTDIKEESSYEATGGTVNFQKATKTDANGYKLDKDTKYIRLNLNKTLAVGDVITIQAYATSNNGGIIASASTSTATNQVIGTLAEKNKKLELTYTVKEQDILNGQKTIYLFRNNSVSTYIQAIKITRANTQVALTAFFSPATISATEGDVAQNLPTLTVKAGETTLTASDYNVTYASDNNAVAKVENGKVSFVGEGETKIVATIKPTDTNKYKENSATFAVKVEKKQTPVDPTESGVIYDFTGSIGTTTDGTSCTTANKVITFSSNFSANAGKYITIKPKTDGFKAGDVITLKGYCNSKNRSGVIIYSDVNGSSIFKSNILATSDTGSEFTYTIEKDCDALYLGRYGGGTTCLTSLQVNRPASSSNKTRLTASFERNADVVVNTTTTATLPTLTVKAGNTTLSADQYKVVYKSNAENVATLSGNTITIKDLGIATITATVTPTDANTYEGTTATYQLSVKAPSPLNVSVMDVTINTTDAEEEQPVIKVYGDNDKLLKLDQDYTLSYTVSGDKNVTVDETTGKFSVKKNAGNTAFIKGTSLITVTATPKASLGSNYIAGTLQFSYSVSEGKIKPVFLDSFKDITINLHQDDTSRKIIVPLIYNGEDVSSYFKYTYTITAANGQIQKFTENTLNYTPSTAGKYTVTVSATPGQNGEDNYGDVYDSPDPISFNLDINITHQVITVTPDPTSLQMYAGTTQVAPDLTVKNGNTTLADTEYQTSWFSTSPGVVKVDAKTGKIEAVSEGTADIRVVVTGETLESTTALITVDVDDPAVYRVHANEEYKSQKTMWNQHKNLSVTLGGWLFPNDVKGLWTTTESLSKTVEWNKDDSQKNYNSRKAPWKITGFDYMVKAGDKQKNARQENGSNSMPETTLISNVDYSKKENIVDPMFNVPCSGSFLTFQPKTNGTVVAHIYQNGVFDSKKNKDNTIDYQYRPQRRVFIMDEAGNFVSSDAHIESTTGKPNGKNYDLTQYKWDMGDKQSPTVETVKKHFGLESFEMSETGFKNNVYENQLDQKIAPNEAATKYPNLKGSRGWSVLADAPVTYTFNVKAGKTYYLYNFGSKIGFYGFSFDEGDTKPTVDPVNYDAETANANNTVEKTADGHVAQVKIARKMVANRWTTCVLPFSLNRDQVDAIFGPAYCAEHPQGTQILYFDRIEGNKAYFVRHAYNTIVAGKPFLIKPTKEVTSINTADVTNYPYVTIENTKPADWCESKGYVWTSSYNTMNIVKNDYFIGASDGNFKAYAAASGTVKGFRGFLKANLSPGAKPVMLSISTSSVTDGNDGETTGIEDLIITTDGELMPANSRVYNINGQLVSEDASSFQSLPSGIYIINGKKYIK
mgnify:CR=1 FL=1